MRRPNGTPSHVDLLLVAGAGLLLGHSAAHCTVQLVSCVDWEV